MGENVIIGAGMAGLGASLRLKKGNFPCTILEKEKQIGGLCRTEKKDGFYFDYTGHLLHFRNDIFKSLVLSSMGINLENRKRSAWIFSKNVYTKYPFQVNLYGLPHDVIVECIYEYSKRYFDNNSSTIGNFRDWIDIHFGSGIANHFMIPYNSKLYRRDPSELSPDCIGRFVPDSDLKMLLRGAISNINENVGYNSFFYYPKTGGIESLVNLFGFGLNISTEEKVVRIKTSKKELVTSKGRHLSYNKLISTLPLNELIGLCEGEINKLREQTRDLKYISVLNINIGIKGKIGENKHWVYIPEEQFVYYRIGFEHNFSDNMTPVGCSSVYMEISYDPVNGIDSEWAIDKCISDLMKMKIIENREQILLIHKIDIPYAYVIFDHKRQKTLMIFKKYLEEQGIYTAGRFGSWDYFSMEDAFMDGWNAAEKIIRKV